MTEERLLEIESHYAVPLREVHPDDDNVRIYRGEGVEADIYELSQEVRSLWLRLRTLAQYASHLGNCTWFQEGDVCSCGLEAFSDVLDQNE